MIYIYICVCVMKWSICEYIYIYIYIYSKSSSEMFRVWKLWQSDSFKMFHCLCSAWVVDDFTNPWNPWTMLSMSVENMENHGEIHAVKMRIYHHDSAVALKQIYGWKPDDIVTLGTGLVNYLHSCRAVAMHQNLDVLKRSKFQALSIILETCKNM